MPANNRFSVAVHIITALAYHGHEGATSQMLAKSVCTNPVVVRRLLSRLHRAGLVDCQPGKSGGCRLAKAPEVITLNDIYAAVEAGGPFAIPDKPENKACAVSCNMKIILTEVFQKTQRAVEDSLRHITLADLVKTVEQSTAR
jgi:Rrf2 family protein